MVGKKKKRAERIIENKGRRLRQKKSRKEIGKERKNKKKEKKKE